MIDLQFPEVRANLQEPKLVNKFAVEELLDATECIRSLETLVHEGCDRNILLFSLGYVRRTWRGEEWESMTGMSREHIKSFKENLLACAQRLERFNRTYAGWLLGVQSGEQCLRDSPRLLHESAQVLQWFLVNAGPKKHPLANFNKLWLVAYVKERTGEWHDREVSELVNAIEQAGGRKTVYSVDSHGNWRRAMVNRKPLAQFRREVRNALAVLTVLPQP
jgi:hypothetical protein